MAATELAAATSICDRQHTRVPPGATVAYTLAALAIITALAAGAELVDRNLFNSPAPHPTLHPTAEAIASIFASNLRILALPFLLIVFRFHTSRAARTAGDLLLIAVVAVNGLRVGLAIGRWQTQLVPYLPHLPLEYAAAAVATSAWLQARQNAITRQSRNTRAIAATGAGGAALLIAAAVVEVLLTPHAR
jgi:Stage II sporulation protein M